MLTLDDQIDRVVAYLAARGISLREAARLAGVHRNTVREALRNRQGRMETFRALESLVPTDFDHRNSSSQVEEGQATIGCTENAPSATKICASAA